MSPLLIRRGHKPGDSVVVLTVTDLSKACAPCVTSQGVQSAEDNGFTFDLSNRHNTIVGFSVKDGTGQILISLKTVATSLLHDVAPLRYSGLSGDLCLVAALSVVRPVLISPVA